MAEPLLETEPKIGCGSTDLWKSIETGLSCKIPLPMKKFLSFLGFDSEVALRGLSEEHFSAMEEQARTVMADVVEENERPDYFGVFAKRPEKFAILSGQKVLLLAIADYLKKNI